MQNGLVTTLSALSYEETCNKIIDLIESNPNLKILLDLDHAENASKVDKELLPTRLIMFGNPNVGTLLMQKQQTIGIDLPQKILIFQNDSGKVFVSYNAPQYLADRHDIFGMDEVLIKIHGLLSSLVEKMLPSSPNAVFFETATYEDKLMMDRFLKKFRKRFKGWLEDLENTKESQMFLKPNEAEWSLAELFDHVMRVGRHYQIASFNKIMTNAHHSRGKRKLAYYFVLKLNYLPRTKIRIQDFPEKLQHQLTPAMRPQSELISDFKNFEKEIERLFQEDVRPYNGKKHYHPFFGDLGAREWLAMVEIHLRHHEPQKKRILEYVNKMKKG